MVNQRSWEEFTRSLEGGLYAALHFLNRRAPHRFTGIYRYDGEVLRNVALVDRFDPAMTGGGDVEMGDAYCALVRNESLDGMLEFDDAATDARFDHKPGSPVVSYCGILIHDEVGQPFGTLCHYDLKRCQAPFHDAALLRAAAPVLFALLRKERLIPDGSAPQPTC